MTVFITFYIRHSEFYNYFMNLTLCCHKENQIFENNEIKLVKKDVLLINNH
jgi:hypothetical protein